MRLYHALLVTATALLASSVSAGQADCDMVPAGSYDAPSGPSVDTPVTQDSTANSNVGASQANQGSAPSDYPVQQDSTLNSNVASGSGAPSSDDDNKQGVVVPGTPTGSDVGASQATTSGSGAPPSYDQGVPTATPGKEGLTTPAPTTPSSENASQQTDVAGEADTKQDTTLWPDPHGCHQLHLRAHHAFGGQLEAVRQAARGRHGG
ncbi:hypothetical protein ON010_g14851 [Phytophthora cinnamomi]|nr:hypothetical protein ON010_g14851 [Phytophthora cinnamomi]